MKWPFWAAIGVAGIAIACVVALRSGPSGDTLAALIQVNFPGVYDVQVLTQVSKPDGRTRLTGTARDGDAIYSIVPAKERAALCGAAAVIVPEGSVVAQVVTPEGAEMTFDLTAPVVRDWIGDHMEVSGWLMAEPMEYVFTHKQPRKAGYALNDLKARGEVIVIGTPEAETMCAKS